MKKKKKMKMKKMHPCLLKYELSLLKCKENNTGLK